MLLLEKQDLRIRFQGWLIFGLALAPVSHFLLFRPLKQLLCLPLVLLSMALAARVSAQSLMEDYAEPSSVAPMAEALLAQDSGVVAGVVGGELPAEPDLNVFTDPTIYTGDSPEAVMTQVFDGATEGTSILSLAQVGEYAVASYQWGGEGGYVVMQKQDGQWSNFCSGGGALLGAAMLSGCGIPQSEATTLWEQFIQGGA